MEGFYEVSSCGNDTAPTVSPEGHVRRFYIAAEEILWDYAPSGKNMLTNNPLNETERWLYILNIFSENILKNDWNCVYYILSHIIAHFTLCLYVHIIVPLFAVTLKNSSVQMMEGWEESTGRSDTSGTTMTHLLPRSSNMVQNIT